ncbi:hypothetical protein BCR32DRAFT_294960 [Anaeromyces robustus]|uniref:MATH domain-containing protein n=1 Tax=Anaeromyces robustus TaxID=1754192 RepID=A0A1Y1WYF1_9FUNG|nr:hypothetical protein BCR32DRAFT_294960 [Anaeromyces robustus]|eukprot:ORX78580.1 hypothetical protein BCR32DRAFT_294960 [Anaeromyces robustus]
MGIFSLNKKTPKVERLTENEFLKRIKNTIKSYNTSKILKEEYHEWCIDNWNKLKNESSSPFFKLNDHLCILYLDKKDLIVKLLFGKHDVNEYPTSDLVYVIRHYKYCAYYKTNSITNHEYAFFTGLNLTNPIGNFELPLLDDNNIIIGVFWRIYVNENKGHDELLDKFNALTKDIDYKPMESFFYEEVMDDVKSYQEYISDEFSFNNMTWTIRLKHKDPSNINTFKDDFDGDYNYYSFSLYCEKDEYDDKNNYVFKFIPYVFNLNDYKCVKYKNPILCQDSRDRKFKVYKLISDKGLFKFRNDSNKSIEENNKAGFGVYINIYKNPDDFDIEKDKYINKLNKLIYDGGDYIINKGYYEFPLEWKNICNLDKVVSPIFEICDHRWVMEIYPKGIDENSCNFVSVYIKCLDFDKDIFLHICSKFIFTLDQPSFYSNGASRLFIYNEQNNSFGYDAFYKRDELSPKSKIGAYVRTYRYLKEYYYKERKELQRNINYIINDEIYQEWEIQNWSNIKNEEILYSPEFEANNQKLRMVLYPNGNNSKKNYMSLYLINSEIEDRSENEKYHHICLELIMFIRHKHDYSYFYSKLLPLGFFRNDNKIIGWDNFINEIYLSKSRIENKNEVLVEKQKFIISSSIRFFDYNEEIYINELKSMIMNTNYSDKDILDEGFYEWKIQNWDQINNYKSSPDFVVGNNNWNITLYPKGKFENNFISIFINNLNMKNNKSKFILFTDFVISIRNPNKYSYFIGKCERYSQSFNNRNNERGYSKFIDSYEIDKLLEDNEIVISVYLRIYKNNYLENYIIDIKNLLNTEEVKNLEIIEEDFIEWKIENWNQFNSNPYFFDGAICSHKWKIYIYPNGNNKENENFVSVFLKCLDFKENKNSKFYIKCVLYLRNYLDYSIFKTQVSKLACINKNKTTINFTRFISKYNFYSQKQDEQLLEDDNIIVGAYIRIYEK